MWYAKKQVAGTADENLPILSAAAPFKVGNRGDASYYTDIPAGPLAIKNVVDLYLYDNVTALLKVTGAQIKEWLEMSAGQFNQIVTNNYRATGNFPGVKDAAEKRLLNLENRQDIIDYIVSEKTINSSADGNWSFLPNIANADIRFASSDNARAHLANQDAISYVGPSTQAGFAEYRLIVKEKANQVEDTANKESEKLLKGAETVDQTKRMTPKVIEGSSLVKPATAIQLSNSQVIILPQAQIQETQVSSSAETLPNTGSDESVSAILAGLVLVTLAGFFGIKKYKKIKQEKKPMSGLFCSSFTVG